MNRIGEISAQLRVTRREFSLLAAATAASLTGARAADAPPKVLIVVAHPDDEYAFAATVYRIAKELGGIVDQVVISNGEGGYRYSTLAEQVYGIALTDEKTGRERLPEIRQRETLAAGRILGIRNHHFLKQKDGGFTLERAEAGSLWDTGAIHRFLVHLLSTEQYQYVFTLLPTADTHGHHKAAALLALNAVQALGDGRRPAVFGAEPAHSSDAARVYNGLAGFPQTQTAPQVFEFSRTRHFGFENALSYSIVVNWVVAEHKSQGLFQTDVGKHDVERYWLFSTEDARQLTAAQGLFAQLNQGPAGASLAAGDAETRGQDAR